MPADADAIKKFKELFSMIKTFKVVFYEAALIDGPYDPSKFKKTAEKVKQSKLKTWYVLVQEANQNARDWINYYRLQTG